MISTIRNILVLGGTTEASALALALAERGERATLSYAGRVAQPRAQPIDVRVGGFGGVAGLIRHLQDEGVTHVVDATHPFAARMSAHAVAACAQAGVPLLALTREPWQPQPGDRWQTVADLPAAAAALGGAPQRVLLALGRMHLATFAVQPQHHYILRLVDARDEPPPVPQHTIIVARGPFDEASDIALLRAHRVDLVVCKNAGGSGAQAKLHAARALDVPVLMVARPPLPARHEVRHVAEVLQWLDHGDGSRRDGSGRDGGEPDHGATPAATSGGAERGV